MAFLDHIDPGNSGGSVPTPDTPFHPILKPVVHPCTICDKRFKDRSALDDHLIAEHPVKRPMLHINGKALRKDDITVRSKIWPDAVEFTDVDEIYVDGKKISSQRKFIEWLCNSNRASFRLRLVKKNYSVKYRWNIDIAVAEELERVDEQFYSAFDSGLDLGNSFSLFNKRVAEFSSAAKNYAAGLSCYVTSVITKDQLPGATLGYEKYGHKLGEAMDILIDYRSKPLAAAVFAIAEFMQNDFHLQKADRCLPKLEVTKQFFSTGSFKGVHELSTKFKSIPIDTATDSIIEFCSSGQNSRAANINSIEALLKASSTDARDRIKSIFILWCFYNLTAEDDKATVLRGKLIHSPCFSNLVEIIEEMTDE